MPTWFVPHSHIPSSYLRYGEFAYSRILVTFLMEVTGFLTYTYTLSGSYLVLLFTNLNIILIIFNPIAINACVSFNGFFSLFLSFKYFSIISRLCLITVFAIKYIIFLSNGRPLFVIRVFPLCSPELSSYRFNPANFRLNPPFLENN